MRRFCKMGIFLLLSSPPPARQFLNLGQLCTVCAAPIRSLLPVWCASSSIYKPYKYNSQILLLTTVYSASLSRTLASPSACILGLFIPIMGIHRSTGSSPLTPGNGDTAGIKSAPGKWVFTEWESLVGKVKGAVALGNGRGSLPFPLHSDYQWSESSDT